MRFPWASKNKCEIFVHYGTTLTTLSPTSLLVARFTLALAPLTAMRRNDPLLTRELLAVSLGKGLERAKREGAKHTAKF